MNLPSNHPTVNVLNTRVHAVDMASTLDYVYALLNSGKSDYICVAGVHGVMEARRCPRLAKAYAEAGLVIPDGMPLVWVGHAQGYVGMQRVTGPDVMLEMFRDPRLSNATHYLYGGTAGVAQQLRRVLISRFPLACIVGASTPPFHELSRREAADFRGEICRLRPDIIWLGVSCPKQEMFMHRYLPMLETKLMVGVGAAFDYHTGRIRDSSEWVKHAGLQWVHRLIQDPRRLWKRYLRNNPQFIFQITKQLFVERLDQVRHNPGLETSSRQLEKHGRAARELEEERPEQSAVA